MNLKLTAEEFHRKLLEVNEKYYHNKHPFHHLMVEGRLSKEQLQAWALNRYYYQSQIPIKDAIILSRSQDIEFRRVWRKRIEDHDGFSDQGAKLGGIQKWLKLAEALDLPLEYVISTEGILPGTRFAVGAYIHFVTNKTLLEAVASSLTELASGGIIQQRMESLKKMYPYLTQGLIYFEERIEQIPKDIDFSLDWVIKNANTADEQLLALNALKMKCSILWAQLDALYYSYVTPNHIPPGAFNPICLT